MGSIRAVFGSPSMKGKLNISNSEGSTAASRSELKSLSPR